MGQLSEVLQALKDGGFRADYAWPGHKMPALTDVAAAVSLQNADLQTGSVTVLITILCPAEQGGAACQDAALTAGELLQGLGAAVTVSACSFDGRTGLFSVAVTATFAKDEEEQVQEAQQIISCTVGLAKLWYVVSFTTQREVEALVPEIEDAAWHFRIEEFFPTGTAEEAWPEEPFHVVNGKEILLNCTWTSHKRVREPEGIRQIREGIAESRSVEVQG